jgi:hypothetical protein
MRSIFVRVEPTVRLVTDANKLELFKALHLLFDTGPMREVEVELKPIAFVLTSLRPANSLPSHHFLRPSAQGQSHQPKREKRQ